MNTLNKFKKKWIDLDSNLSPSACEVGTLPLSYRVIHIGKEKTLIFKQKISLALVLFYNPVILSSILDEKCSFSAGKSHFLVL